MVCSLQPRRHGEPFCRHVLRKRFHTACHWLGQLRLNDLTIHHGRHTFISHALAGGRTLAEVRDAVAHTTSCYLHIAVDDDGTPGANCLVCDRFWHHPSRRPTPLGSRLRTIRS